MPGARRFGVRCHALALHYKVQDTFLSDWINSTAHHKPIDRLMYTYLMDERICVDEAAQRHDHAGCLSRRVPSEVGWQCKYTAVCGLVYTEHTNSFPAHTCFVRFCRFSPQRSVYVCSRWLLGRFLKRGAASRGAQEGSALEEYLR